MFSFTPYVCKQAKEFAKTDRVIIHVRYVTRGTNPQTMIESCHDIINTITDASLSKRAEWILEVVTDNYMELEKHVDNVHQIIVKED